MVGFDVAGHGLGRVPDRVGRVRVLRRAGSHVLDEAIGAVAVSARACYDCDLRLPLAVVICPVCTGRMHYARLATPDEHWEDNGRAIVQAKVDY